MAQLEKDNRFIIKDSSVLDALLEGAGDSYKAVTSTYGPKGANVLIEKPFGRPLLTRDGVTVARDVYFKKRDKNMGAQLACEASETTNRIAGDGTTATIALYYHLLNNGALAIRGGKHPMDIKQQYIEDSYKVLDALKKLSKKTKKSQLKEVATVSAGDPLLGQLIAEAIERVGEDGGIITEKSHVQDVEREYVDGYYLQNGFQALQQGRKELVDPFVIVSNKRLTSGADIVEIFTKIMKIKEIQPGQQIPRILLIGNIEDAAYNLVCDNINRGIIDAIIIQTPPQFGNMSKQLLEDIAIYADCLPIDESTNIKMFNDKYIGQVSKVIATKSDATIFSDNTTEGVKDRVQDIKDQIENESVDAILEKLRDRVSKLEGKIALFRIGGATDTEKEEKEFRVEDAIQATRAAYSHGVVAGGGITLLNLSKEDISEEYRNALRDTFKKLLINANIQPSVDVKLNEALNAPVGHGFNLREGNELVDMVAAGILDPTLVVEQVIKNATSNAAAALTSDTMIIFEDKTE